eukprot:4832813-Prymnesium_polylepis.1
MAHRSVADQMRVHVQWAEMQTQSRDRRDASQEGAVNEPLRDTRRVFHGLRPREEQGGDRSR